MEGTMLWFNPVKRHGFIWTDDGERLRVDRDGFASGQSLEERCKGTRVTFERACETNEEPRAVNVALVPVLVGQRARARGRR